MLEFLHSLTAKSVCGWTGEFAMSGDRDCWDAAEGVSPRLAQFFCKFWALM